jgi:hypothetical protein
MAPSAAVASHHRPIDSLDRTVVNGFFMSFPPVEALLQESLLKGITIQQTPENSA